MNMKKLSPVIILLCALSGFTSAALAQQSKMVNEKDAAELTEIYREIDEADEKMVLEVIDKYLGDDYSVESNGEKFNKKQTVKRVKEFYKFVKEISEAKSTIKKIEPVKGQYAVEVDSITVGKMYLPNEKIVDFYFTSKTTDFWRRDKQNKWRETAQIDRGTKIVIDGKEFPAN